jgi:hypothetical protein
MNYVVFINSGEVEEINSFASATDADAYYRQKCRALGLPADEAKTSKGWYYRRNADTNTALFVCSTTT